MEVGKPDFEHVVKSSRGGRQVNPWLRILNQQVTLMASLGDRLGLNPKARASLHMPEDRPASKFDGLLGTVGRKFS
jgi:phage terminase small subunit